jgi:hypothetical protein
MAKMTKEKIEQHRTIREKYYDRWGEGGDKLIVDLCTQLLAAMEVVEAVRGEIHADTNEEMEQWEQRKCGALSNYDKLGEE